MFSHYCRLCKEHYNGCFGEEIAKHDNCIQPPIPEMIKLDKPIIFDEACFRGPPTQIWSKTWPKIESSLGTYQEDIRKILEENSVKDLHELAKDS